MKKIISMIAVTAIVLMLGIAPVLAAGEEAGAAGDFATNEGATEVKLVTDSSALDNISATVPLNVTLAVNAAGTITAPTNYAIANTSVFDIKVTHVTATPASGFAFTKAAFANAKEMNITLQPGSGANINLADFSAKTVVPVASAADWNIASSDSLNLKFAGSVNKMGDITTAEKAFTVTYTIAAGTATNA